MFLKLIFIILYCMFLINFCSPKTTTTKKTKTTKASTSPVVKQKLVECYQSYKGYYESKFYNVSSPIKCKSNCYTYKGLLILANFYYFAFKI